MKCIMFGGISAAWKHFEHSWNNWEAIWEHTAISLGSTGNIIFRWRHELGVKTSNIDKFATNHHNTQVIRSQIHSPFSSLVIYFSFCYLHRTPVRGRAFQTDASISMMLQSGSFHVTEAAVEVNGALIICTQVTVFPRSSKEVWSHFFEH